MEIKVEQFIKANNIVKREDRILIAISGGVDSVVLLDILHKLGYTIALAHCNFNLRGDESDQDTSLVETLAEKYNIKLHTKHFNTIEYAKLQKVSIEMAARELRYEWFAELCKNYDYKYVALAHHLNDQIETVLINLSRGTGIRGIRGMNIKNKNLIRPLLSSTREEIENYASLYNILYRNDSTNDETVYVRNKIRHNIIPTLKEINPNIENTFLKNLNRFKEIEAIYNSSINEAILNSVIVSENQTSIDIKKLLDYTSPKTLLHEIINKYGFNDNDIDDILRSIDGVSGKTFNSTTHILIKDRTKLIISKTIINQNSSYIIDSVDDKKDIPINLKFSIEERESINFSKDQNIALFDVEKINFPLILRRWKSGDFFHPFGMKGKKKLSNYFSDNKFSILDKQNTWILESSDGIIWVVGHRTDNRFRLTKNSKNALKIVLT